MSAANYEWCPGCDTKVLYVGEEEVGEDVVVWHRPCHERSRSAAVAAERERIRQLARDFNAMYSQACLDEDCRNATHYVHFADLLEEPL